MIYRALTLLALLLGVAYASEQDDAAKQASAERATVECPACEGQGTSQLDCRTCDGRGTPSCDKCNLEKYLEQRAKNEALSYKDRLLSKKLSRQPAPNRLGAPAGKLRCSNCIGGNVMLKGKCLLCAGKGFRACHHCKKGRRKCTRCLGRRKRLQTCLDCAGSGRLPVSTDVKVCTWCSGQGKRDCHACDETGEILAACGTCLDTRKRSCDVCFGSRKAPCSTCSCTGKYGGKRCDQCKGSGRRGCVHCKRGKIECEECDDDGERFVNCEHCKGKRELPCHGCHEGELRSWEATAKSLIASGKRERGEAYLREALVRLESLEQAQLKEPIPLELFGRAKILAQTKKRRKALEQLLTDPAKR